MLKTTAPGEASLSGRIDMAASAGHALTFAGMPAGLATLAGLYDLGPLLSAGE